MNRLLKTGIACVVFGFSMFGIRAQDYERFAPKLVPQEERVSEVPSEVPEAVGEQDVLVEEFKGLVIVDSLDAVSLEGSSTRGISAEGFDLLRNETFPKVVEPYFGQPLSLKSLNELVRDIIIYYRDNDYPVVDVIVPEQEITNGTVQLVVVEGRVDDVEVEGNKWFATRTLKGQVRVQSGDRIRATRLLKDVSWLNRNPFRSVDLVFAPGEELGTTDVIFRTQDRFPVRFYAGYEDSGNDITGDERWVLGFNWGDAFWQGHQLNYQYTASSNFQDIGAHSASYVVPLPWRHTLTAFVSFVESETQIPGTTPFNLQGNSAQAGIRYTIPLPEIENYQHELFAGFDWKQSDSSLEFGVVPVTANTTDVGQFLYGYRGTLPDSHGVTSLDVQVVHSPGDWFPHQNDADYRATRAQARAEYTYMRLKLSRLTKLPWEFSLYNEFNWQLANVSLLSSEQLGFGGYNSIRGYDERELSNTDKGWFIRNELRTPPISISQLFSKPFGSNWANDQLQFLVFWDYGIAQSNNGLVTRADGNTLRTVYMSGIGPGIRYSIGNYLSIRADYAFQLNDTGNARYDSRWHLGVIVSY
ncbi:MAG: ShlB/FhaC/HecB family hemolysin secretion/activation protein [Verrucomicrobiota bacterium]